MIAEILAFLQSIVRRTDYRTVSHLYGLKRLPQEVISNGWTAWLLAAPRSLLYGSWPSAALRVPENSLFPGVVPLLLLVVAIVPRFLGVPRSSSANATNLPEEPRGTRGTPRNRILTLLLIPLSILFICSLMRDRLVLELFGIRLFAIRGTDFPFAALVTVLLLRLPLRDWIARSRFSVEAWMAAVWMLTGFAGSFGMRTPFYVFLFNKLEPFQGIRAVTRFAVITYAGMVVFVAIGAALIAKRRIAKAGLVALALLDVLPNIQWQAAPSRVPPVYRWLKQGPVLELPIDGDAEFQYLLGQTHHHVPLLNGISGYEPPEHKRLRETWERKEMPELLAYARELGANVLIVHEHRLDPEQKRLLFAVIQQQGLPSLQNFEHESGADLVFLLN